MTICPQQIAESHAAVIGISSNACGLCLVSAVVVTSMLFYLGAQPIAVHLFPVPWDKLAHLLVFGVIAGLLWVGSAGLRPLSVFGTVTAIGILDEWHQAWRPGRSMDLMDLLTDMAAAALVITALQVAKAISSNKSTLMAKPCRSGFNPTSAHQPPRRVETRPTKSDDGYVHYQKSPKDLDAWQQLLAH